MTDKYDDPRNRPSLRDMIYSPERLADSRAMMNPIQVRGFLPAAGFDQALLREPQRGTSKSAGYDLHALTEPGNNIHIAPGGSYRVKTGITAYMQPNEVLILKERSGLADKGLHLGGGVIDADYYPKEIQVILYNTGPDEMLITNGDRICQGVFLTYGVTDSDSPRERERTGGFGSTGMR